MEQKLSVILIAHNEEESIAKIVPALFAHYDREIFEVIVVDDASTDQTVACTENLIREYPKLKLIRRAPPCGVGRALKTGFQAASSEADYILSMDSDFVDNIEGLRSMIDTVEKGYDGAIGSRFIDGGRLIGYPLKKKMLNRLFHFVVHCLFHIKQKDLTNNLKLYRKEIFKKLPWRSDHFSMNAETGILPILAGYKIDEVPVSWTERKLGMGKSKFSLFKHGWEYARVIAYALEFQKKRTGRFERQLTVKLNAP